MRDGQPAAMAVEGTSTGNPVGAAIVAQVPSAQGLAAWSRRLAVMIHSAGASVILQTSPSSMNGPLHHTAATSDGKRGVPNPPFAD